MKQIENEIDKRLWLVKRINRERSDGLNEMMIRENKINLLVRSNVK